MKWIEIAARGINHAILVIDLVAIGINRDYCKKFYNINYRVKHYRQFNGTRSISEEDYKILIRLLDGKTKNNPNEMLKNYSNFIEECSQKLFDFADEYKDTDWSKKSDKELAKHLLETIESLSKAWGGLGIYFYHFYFNRIVMEEFLESLKKRLGNIDDLFPLITSPHKTSENGKFKLGLMELALESIETGKNQEKELQNLWEKFSYLKRYYFWGEGYTLNEVKAMLNEEIKKGKKLKKEIRELKKEYSVNDFNLTKNERDFINSMRKAFYYSNYIDEAANYNLHYLMPLYLEITKRLGIKYNDLASMLLDEILESLEKGKLVVPKNDLKQRYKDHILIYTNGTPKILIGKELEEYRKEHLKETELEVKELKGTVTNKGGIVTGKVRIIHSHKDVPNFKKGEILVTPMTTPNYVPAMQVAKAIVTDEGGVLCHAAIVSRELGVPCVIGTKIATKFLKTGDLIEVNTNTGIIAKKE